MRTLRRRGRAVRAVEPQTAMAVMEEGGREGRAALGWSQQEMLHHYRTARVQVPAAMEAPLLLGPSPWSWAALTCQGVGQRHQ